MAPDVLALSAIWTGELYWAPPVRCTRLWQAPEQAEPFFHARGTPEYELPNTVIHSCEVAAWTSVRIISPVKRPRPRQLALRSDNPNMCPLERFGPRVEIINSSMSNIVSTLVAYIEGGPFDRTCAYVSTYWVKPGGCELTIVKPRNRNRINAGTCRSLLAAD